MTQFFDSMQVGLEKVAEFIGQNVKVFIGVFAALIIIGTALTGFSYNKKSQEVAGFSDLSPLESEYNKWKMGQTPNPESTEKPPVVDTEKLFSDLSKLIESKPHLKASQLASLMLADLGFSLGKEKEVLDAMKNLKSSSGDLLSAVATLKKGDLLANQNQCDQALTTWTDLLKSKNYPFLKDLVHLKSGLCEEKLLQKDKALGHYNSVIGMKDLKADRWAYKEAQKYKRALTWSQN